MRRPRTREQSRAQADGGLWVAAHDGWWSGVKHAYRLTGYSRAESCISAKLRLTSEQQSCHLSH